eukprot:EG_transcript_20863
MDPLPAAGAEPNPSGPARRLVWGLAGLVLGACLATTLGPWAPGPSAAELHHPAGLRGVPFTVSLRTAGAAGKAVTPSGHTALPQPRPWAVETRPAMTLSAASPATLYDTPVSNHGARVRLVIYWKGLEDRVVIKSPAEAGGLKSPEYLAINPQGKMPSLVLPDGSALPESEVISQFLLDSFPEVGPRLLGATPLERAEVALLTRYHDLYLAPVQGAMYRAMGAEERRAGLQQIHQQLRVIEGRARAAPYLAGSEPTAADAALFPTAVFLNFILPRHFGWASAFDGCPKLAQWFDFLSRDPQGARVRAEVEG